MIAIVLASACGRAVPCPREIPSDRLLFSIVQQMTQYVSYKGHFAEVNVDGVSATGFRKRSCRVMDVNAFRALKELLASPEFRKEFEVTASRDYAQMGGEEPMLVVAYGKEWTSIPF
jgi:hypothetical protein